MAAVDRLISVFLDGSTPPGLDLAELSHLGESVALVETAFSPFMSAESDVLRLCDLPIDHGDHGPDADSSKSVVVVYLIGHGWVDSDGVFQTSMMGSDSEYVSGTELMRQIGRLVLPNSRVLVIVDTCEAESLEGDLQYLPTEDYTAIFASRRGDQAWNVAADQGTRLAFSIAEALGDARFLSQPRDAVELCTRVKALIDEDVSTPDQSITRLVHGRPIVLTSDSAIPDSQRRHRARRRLALRLMFGGIGFATFVFLAASYWRSHVFVFVELKDLSDVSEQPTIVAYQTEPETNVIREIRRMRVDGHSSAWLFLPADNLIITVEATYKDRENRELRFHRVFHAGFNVQKSCRLVLPAESEIINRPRMAFVSAESWFKGSDRSKAGNVRPFWIDIEQVTIREYFPELMRMFRAGSIRVHESVLLTDLHSKNDLDLHELPRKLDAILQMDIHDETLLKRPDCPAPMTETEAKLVAKCLGKSTPTQDQWELAARGVDGRQFPWGELVNNDAVNAGLPQEVGWEHRRTLRPSSGYRLNKSPFGMNDVVGNAGEWVCDDGQFGFMGGELRLNPEDCTTFSYMRLPSAQAGLADFAWRVGFRGVLPSARSTQLREVPTSRYWEQAESP